MPPSLLSLLAFGSIVLAAFGVGRPIVRGLRVADEDSLATAVWSIALGAIAAGTLLAGLGLVGALYAPVIGGMTVAACFWGLGEMLRAYLAACDRRLAGPTTDSDATEPLAPWSQPSVWLCRGILAAAAVACVGSLVSSLAPPTAGDALCYHLELPKTFLAEHRLVFLPYHDNATFPLLTEMWFLWALALDGGVCAQLVHWGLGVLLCLATVVLATPILGRRWAWIAAAAVALTPGVNNQMTAPLNDLALAAMTTLALAAWWRAVVADEGRRWFVLAGLAGGGALGVKYLALVFAAAVGLCWTWSVWRLPYRRRMLLQGAAVVVVVAASVGGHWYVRAAWYRGNPVFPFLHEAVGAANASANTLPDALPDTLPDTLPASKSPLGRHPLQMAAAPWHVTMSPERFGGRGHQLGVVLLAALPGLLFCRRLHGLGTLLSVAGCYAVLWFLLRQNVRFLLPVVPLAYAAAVWVWIEMRRFPAAARRVAAAAFVCALAAMTVVPLRRGREHFQVALGVEDRESYLVGQEPTYRAAVVANALAGPEGHLLTQDYRSFYFNCRVTRESIYRRLTHYDRSFDDAAGSQPLDRLRQAGFTHLLLAESLSDEGIQYDPTLSRLADADDTELDVLTEYTFADRDGAVRRYRLVELR